MSSRVDFRVLLLLLAVVPVIGCASSAPMTMHVEDEGALRSSRSIAIHDFTLQDATVNYKGDTAALGHEMAVLLADQLRASGATVTTMGANDSAAADLVVNGRFTTIDEG